MVFQTGELSSQSPELPTGQSPVFKKESKSSGCAKTELQELKAEVKALKAEVKAKSGPTPQSGQGEEADGAVEGGMEIVMYM